MPQSTVTSKYQTTVPKEIRLKLGIKPHDVLRWEIEGSEVRVSVARQSFLKRRGSIQVGPGSVADDVRLARTKRS